MDNLRHMAGADQRYSRAMWGFRNHFCAGGEDMMSMLRMERLGLVIRGKKMQDLQFFHATEAGLKLIGFDSKQIEKALSG